MRVSERLRLRLRLCGRLTPSVLLRQLARLTNPCDLLTDPNPRGLLTRRCGVTVGPALSKLT